MPLNRLPDVLLSNQTLTGVSADYLDGITSSTFSQSLRANRNINGGGTVTFDINGNLYWSNRFIIISNGRGPHYALDGYFDAYCPTSGTINGFGSAFSRSATGAGINLGQWDALYVITPIGGSYSSISYAVVSYLADFEVPHNWVLIAVRNGDDGFAYLPNGMVLEPGQSKTSAVTGNLKVGTSNTENYIVFRGTNGDNPGGFDHTFIGERIYGGAEQAELVLFKGNDNDPSSGPDRIRLIASNHVFDTYTAPVSGPFSTVTASASNATRMIIKENGHVGIGTITPNTIATSSTPAMLGIVSNAVGTTGLVIRTIASQTARLQQWQNSAGTVLVEISAGGDLFMSNATRAFFGGSSSNAYLNVSTLGNPVRQGIIVSGGTSQTGNLQEWQDSAGTVISRINPDGHLIASSRSMFGGATSIVSGMIIAAVSQEAAATPILARGSASQTADLQQWQNSSGTVLSRINSSGFLSTPRINFTGGTSTVSALALSDGTLSFESTAGQLFSISNSLTGTIFSVNDVSGLPIIEATDLGIIKINELYGQTVFGSGTPTASALTTFVARTTSTIPVVVKGIASQSANLQNWYAGDGTLGTRIGPYGELVGHNQLANGIGGTVSLTMWSVISGNAVYIPIIARGAASQTANLQEWQNSGGTVLAKITASGALDVTAITVNGAALSGYSAPTIGSTSIASGATVTTLAGLTSVSSTSFVGALTGNASTVTNGVYTNSANIITAASSTTIPIIAKAAASQTADLQQWQNSAGDVISAINSSGFFAGNSVNLANFGQLYQVGLTANQVTVVVSGATSQTADLQEWRSNQSSAAVAKIDVNGNFKGGLVYDIKDQTGTSYTFVLSDSKAVVTLSNANNITASVPTNSTAFPIGSSITVIQYGQGQVTIQALTPGTTTIISNAVTPAAPRLRGILSSATLIKVSAEGWIVIGDIY